MNNIKEYKKRFYNLMESTMGDARPLISEQEVKDFSTEIFEDLKKNGFTINNSNANFVEATKGLLSLLFQSQVDTQQQKYYKLTVIKHKLAIDLNIERISPDLLSTFTGVDQSGGYVGSVYSKPTEEDKEFLNTLSRKDRWDMSNSGPTEKRQGFHMWKSNLGDLNLTTLGQSKETTNIYKYMKDFYAMGVSAQKYQDFSNANFVGTVKLAGQELKSLAAPVVDKAKQGIQNMVSKVKTKLQR
jgi:hypothetical protein